jgi:4'-phosphopantetheinyl transferase
LRTTQSYRSRTAPRDTLLRTPAVPTLIDVPVLVWSCPLDLPETARLRLLACLPAAERDGAKLPTHPLDRRRLLTARAWRRHLLAAELGCDPRDVPIIVDGRGKPRVAGARDGELRFNASRSRDWTLVVLSRRMEVGVDLEAVDPAIAVERFAARFLAAGEQDALAQRPLEERRDALFDCWTRKEAYLKGTGTGLSVPPATVSVWAGDDRPVTVADWSVHSLAVATGFAAAVAGSEPHGWTPSGPHKHWPIFD